MMSSSFINALIEHHQLNPIQVDQLLNPQPYSQSKHESFLQAKTLLLQAIKDGQKMLIYGDYDADGLCSTTILYLLLKRLNAKVSYYLPHRFNDGYGLQVEFVQRALAAGVDLFICVDNGVSAHEALAAIRAAHKASIVIDHHDYANEVNTDVLVHSTLLEAPHHSLCSSGLAHQLAWHMGDDEPYYRVLAGIASVADMMPLWGYNRSIVQAALELLNQKQFSHLQALFRSKDHITEEDLAFQLIPKLNAVGRMADDLDINLMVKYLSFNDSSLRQTVLSQLENLNDKRKELQKEMYALAKEQVQSEGIICVAGPRFHEGVVGIIAGQLAREFNRPAIILHQNDTLLKGSARSVGTFNLLEALQSTKQHLVRIGGHAAALGLELSSDQYPLFLEALRRIELHTDDLTSTTTLPLNHAWLNENFIPTLEALRPFGQGFELPLFEISAPVIGDVQPMRVGFRFRVRFQDHQLDALSFSPTQSLDQLLSATRLYGRFLVDHYQGKKRLKFVVDEVA
jgi:single-stranded-DNA-specific exonuclease